MESIIILWLINQLQIKARTAWFIDPYGNDITQTIQAFWAKRIIWENERSRRNPFHNGKVFSF
jgi:hypothetical protein